MHTPWLRETNQSAQRYQPGGDRKTSAQACLTPNTKHKPQGPEGPHLEGEGAEKALEKKRGS